MSRAIRPGPRNLLTDVAGLSVGHARHATLATGVTVILAPGRVPAGADVRGGGPGTREIEALSAENLVGGLHALVLSGGSALGLGAGDAVAAALSARGEGLPMAPGLPPVPIVPSAILFDLAPGFAETFAAEGGPPHPRLAREALAAAGPDFALGTVGAGTGAHAGRIKGGLGSASVVLPGLGADGRDVTVAALVAANPVGSVLIPGSRAFWAWPFEMEGPEGWEFGGLRPDPHAPRAPDPLPEEGRLSLAPADAPAAEPGRATAIGLAATDLALTSAECRRLAMMAQDGLARAIRPAHTPMDGDTIFSLSTEAIPAGDARGRALRLAAVGSAAADCVARSVARAVHAATALPNGRPAWRDLA
ncbi:P1 family peptidase [Albimonas sp. CAU 1670]|uniref:P1 family peptidase n=1 Tax=Albimonas sp. CAU 1670 TaxID=3032599 RepID=UPI0023DC2F04|nr:P1 family peptidase [Albimonas sp. CAU 1670]MDF2234860.1 P1 family peptidase [Albimonas sp. CAU 1670]